MPPLPKKKHSRSRVGGHRSHLALGALPLSPCPHCHSLRLAHRACPVCGQYRGRTVLLEEKPRR